MQPDFAWNTPACQRYGKKPRKSESKCCGVPVATLCCFKRPAYAALDGVDADGGADDVGFFGSGEDSEMAMVAALCGNCFDIVFI